MEAEQTVAQALSDALESNKTAAERLNEGVRTIARLLMTFRVARRDLDIRLARVAREDKAVDSSLYSMTVAINQIENATHEMDMVVVGDLSVSQQLIEMCEEFARERASSAIHSLSDPAVRQQVLAMTGGVCTYCAVPLTDGQPVEGQTSKLYVEHVVPSSKGGPNHLCNYVPSCGSCNSAKGDRHVLHFVRKVQPQRTQPAATAEVIPMQHRSW